MSFFSTIFNAFSSKSAQAEDTVLEVKSSNYARIPITCRRECLVLYGPKNDKFELILLKPLTPSRSNTTDFSLFRADSQEEALQRMNQIQETIISLVQICESYIMNKTELQRICDLLKEQPFHSAGHVIVSLEYTRAFTHTNFQNFLNLSSSNNGLTPLHIAIKKENSPMVETLISMGASLKEKDFNGNYVYHFAASTTARIIVILATHDKSSLNYQNKNGKSALHMACEKDKPEVVKELLRQGADVHMAATIDSAFPIHTAVNAGSSNCVKEILAMYPKMISTKDIKDGGTPLHWSMSKDMVVSLIEQGCLIDARNFKKASALHKMVANDRFECVLALLSHGADVSIVDDSGNEPLHYASSVLILQALLVFKSNLNLRNNKGESVRHRVACSKYTDKNLMLYHLNSLDAKRCPTKSSICTNGCVPNGNFDGVPPKLQVTSRLRSCFDELLDANMIRESLASRNLSDKSLKNKKGRVLCLDGGGIKGLVLIQLLSSIEDISGTRIKDLFDWIAGTSTGAILAIAVSIGFNMLECMILYFKMKDKIFIGMKPYSDGPLCTMLKEKFGEQTVMTDITGPRLIIPAILANKDPADLHLFRNYISGEDIYIGKGGTPNQTDISNPEPPATQLVWKAARASSAAPTYFTPFEDFIDGGIISNNPTLDALTEIAEYNTMKDILNIEEECYPASLVLSLGVGKPPVMKTTCLSGMQTMSYMKQINMVLSIPDMLKLLVDQACMSDHHAVDRARAWCGQCGVNYLRLSPQLSQNVELDEVRDDVIINMLWETLVYTHENKAKITSFVEKLMLAGCQTSQSGPLESSS